MSLRPGWCCLFASRDAIFFMSFRKFPGLFASFHELGVIPRYSEILRDFPRLSLSSRRQDRQSVTLSTCWALPRVFATFGAQCLFPHHGFFEHGVDALDGVAERVVGQMGVAGGSLGLGVTE